MNNMDEISQLCRLCLIKDQVNQPIFDETSDAGEICIKINSYLPVKVSRDDKLPKKICNGCSYKLAMIDIFRNTSAASETQLLSWLNQSSLRTIPQDKDPLANILTVKNEIFVAFQPELTSQSQNMALLADTKPEDTLTVKEETVTIKQEVVETVDISFDSDNCSLQETQLEYEKDIDCFEKKETCFEMDSDDDLSTPSDLIETSEIVIPVTSIDCDAINLLAEKSRKRYEAIYSAFMEWRILKKINSFSENVVLTYFTELAEKYKSSSLWSAYSMLRSMLSVNNNVNIQNYSKVRAFLKRKAEGYRAKKAKAFTSDEINKFLAEAPDEIHLVTKVALIMGMVGACRASELHAMSIDNFEDLGSSLIVHIPNTKTKFVRKFTLTDHFYQIYKKYINLRPKKVVSPAFFLNYQRGICTSQKIGINKFGRMGKQIAKFLKLPNPDMYTGHCFRRSSYGHLDSQFTALKKRGPWNPHRYSNTIFQ